MELKWFDEPESPYSGRALRNAYGVLMGFVTVVEGKAVGHYWSSLYLRKTGPFDTQHEAEAVTAALVKIEGI